MKPSLYSFMDAGGHVHENFENNDWIKTSAGSLAAWPQSLRTTLNILIGSQFPMFICWKPDRVCFYNEASRDQLGNGSDHQVVGSISAKEAWPEIWELINPIVDEVLLTGRSMFIEDQQILLYRNGSLNKTYWSISYCPLLNEKNILSGVLVTCVDITEKVIAGQQLQESNLQLKFAIEAAELGTFDYNPQTNTFTANGRLKKWFGLPDDAEFALPIALERIIDNQQAAVFAAIQASFNPHTGGGFEIEYTLKAIGSDPEKRICAKGRVFFDEQNTAIRLSGTLKDITHHVEMREKITFLAQLAEQSDDAIIAVRPNDSIVTWNAGAVEMYGYVADEMIGKKLSNILRSGSGLTGKNEIPWESNDVIRLRHESQHLRKDGSLIDVSVTMFPVKDEFGTLLGIASISRDVTEAKREALKKQADKVKEQQVINREKLKAQECERNKLGTDLHDNICQVLAAVKLKLGFFLSMQPEPPEIINDCIKYVEEALVETRDISHRMIMPRFADVSLESALVTLGNIYHNSDRTVTVTKEIEILDALPVSHKEALYRIAQEQFNNMHKYSQASEVKVILTVEEELVRLTIEDNGVGFDPADKKNGIGLANIRNRAELLNGIAKIVTAPGEGCFLVVQIPLEKEVPVQNNEKTIHDNP